MYPPNHIEVDDRISWFRGRLDESYGDNAIYVHLKRNDAATARSFMRRYYRGIIKSYRSGIITEHPIVDNDPMEMCLDYCKTVNSNIKAFLKDKTKKMNFSLENAKKDFRDFWTLIGAEGDLEAALSEWDINTTARYSWESRIQNSEYRREKNALAVLSYSFCIASEIKAFWLLASEFCIPSNVLLNNAFTWSYSTEQLTKLRCSIKYAASDMGKKSLLKKIRSLLGKIKSLLKEALKSEFRNHTV